MACNKALSLVACSIEFTNNANEDLYLLKRNTPLEGFYSEFVSVSLDGGPIPYQGPIAHRVPPTKDGFVLLKAGESISATVQITDVFRIDTDGLYTVQYSRPLQYLSVNEMNAMSIDELKDSSVHKSIQIYLEDTHLLLRPKKEGIKIDHTVHIQGCASANIANGPHMDSDTLDIHKRLCAGIDKALKQTGNGNSVYQGWFGKYSSARDATVKETYQKIKDTLSTGDITYYNNGPECKNDGDFVSYSCAGYPNVIFLCQSYYDKMKFCNHENKNMKKEHIIMHEWAKVVGCTDHLIFGGAYGYGAFNSIIMAAVDPDKAVEDAHNYAYHYCQSMVKT